MSIDLYWDNDEQTVFLAEFNGTWNWDELYNVLSTIKRLSLERNRTFGAIIDVTNGLNLPGGNLFNREGLANFRRMLQFDPESKGPVVVVGMNAMVRSVFDAVARFDRNLTRDVHFASTIDEARRIIYGLVATLGQETA